jgi:hypothetical protein
MFCREGGIGMRKNRLKGVVAVIVDSNFMNNKLEIIIVEDLGSRTL